MKTKILSSLLLLSLITACAKDPSIAPAGGVGPKNFEKDLLIGSFPTSAFMVEKQVEALEVLRLALPTSEELKTQYTREIIKESRLEDGGLVRTAVLKSDAKAFNYKVGEGNYSVSLDKQWNLSSTAADGKIVSIEATKVSRPLPSEPGKPEKTGTAQQKTTLDRKDVPSSKKSFVNVFEDDLTVQAVLAEDGETMKVTVSTTGSFAARKEGRNARGEKFVITVTFDINSKALLNDEVIITRNLVGNSGFNGGKFKVATSSPEMKVRLSGLCNDLEGQAVIDTDKNKKTLVYTKENLTVSGTGIDVPAAECGSRPTTDLTRFLGLL